MSNENLVRVSGPIMFDPSKLLKHIGDNAVAKNIFAIDIGTNGKKSAFNIVAWEALAEDVANVPEGTFVTVTGQLYSRSWKNKQTDKWEREQGVVAVEIEGLNIGGEIDPNTIPECDVPF